MRKAARTFAHDAPAVGSGGRAGRSILDSVLHLAPCFDGGRHRRAYPSGTAAVRGVPRRSPKSPKAMGGILRTIGGMVGGAAAISRGRLSAETPPDRRLQRASGEVLAGICASVAFQTCSAGANFYTCQHRDMAIGLNTL